MSSPTGCADPTTSEGGVTVIRLPVVGSEMNQMLTDWLICMPRSQTVVGSGRVRSTGWATERCGGMVELSGLTARFTKRCAGHHSASWTTFARSSGASTRTILSRSVMRRICDGITQPSRHAQRGTRMTQRTRTWTGASAAVANACETSNGGAGRANELNRLGNAATVCAQWLGHRLVAVAAR